MENYTIDVNNIVRYDLKFTGRVQGVGFRYTTCRIAGRFMVAGWVRNESDGSVRCVVEGEREELDRFVAAIRDALNTLISDVHQSHSNATGEFDGFEIRR